MFPDPGGSNPREANRGEGNDGRVSRQTGRRVDGVGLEPVGEERENATRADPREPTDFAQRSNVSGFLRLGIHASWKGNAMGSTDAHRFEEERLARIEENRRRLGESRSPFGFGYAGVRQG